MYVYCMHGICVCVCMRTFFVLWINFIHSLDWSTIGARCSLCSPCKHFTTLSSSPSLTPSTIYVSFTFCSDLRANTLTTHCSVLALIPLEILMSKASFSWHCDVTGKETKGAHITLPLRRHYLRFSVKSCQKELTVLLESFLNCFAIVQRTYDVMLIVKPKCTFDWSFKKKSHFQANQVKHDPLKKSNSNQSEFSIATICPIPLPTRVSKWKIQGSINAHTHAYKL